MKKIILMVLTMVMTLGVVELSAATKKSSETKSTQFITNINCDQCTKKIMNYIPTQKGVIDVKVDLHKKLVTVTYDAGKTKDATLIKKFSKIDIVAKVYDPKTTTSKTTTSSTPGRTETTQSSSKQTQTQSIQQDQRNR